MSQDPDTTTKIETFWQRHEEEIIADIARLVAISSLEGPPAPGAPFGGLVRHALDEALHIAGRLGLQTQDGEGYVGWAELPGREEGHIATIAHLDVVPAGEGWGGDAFALRQQEGWLLGRGVIDDKGPAVLCLWAAKLLGEVAAQQGRAHRYGLRVLLGCNEEAGMGDIDYYLERQPQPLFCFTPDADFPLCNGEKGILSGQFTSPPLAGNILECNAGVASNVIPDSASCLLHAPTLPADPIPTADVSVAREGDMLRLSAKGVGGHAARPEGTRNAIGLLVDFLLANALCSPEEARFLKLLQALHGSTAGKGLGIACADDAFGPLTCIGGILQLREGRLVQDVNIRFPTTTSGAALVAALQKAAAPFDAGFAADSTLEPFYIPVDSPPIAALLAAYREAGGDPEAQPFTIGGGTYARHFARAVSFGPQPKDLAFPPFAGPEHAPNEGLPLEGLRAAFKTYVLALLRLMELDF